MWNASYPPAKTLCDKCRLQTWRLAGTVVNKVNNVMNCSQNYLKINFKDIHNNIYIYAPRLQDHTCQPASLQSAFVTHCRQIKKSTKILIMPEYTIAYPELHQEKHLLWSFVIQFFEASLLFWKFVVNLSDINCLKLVLEKKCDVSTCSVNP